MILSAHLIKIDEANYDIDVSLDTQLSTFDPLVECTIVDSLENELDYDFDYENSLDGRQLVRLRSIGGPPYEIHIRDIVETVGDVRIIHIGDETDREESDDIVVGLNNGLFEVRRIPHEDPNTEYIKPQIANVGNETALVELYTESRNEIDTGQPPAYVVYLDQASDENNITYLRQSRVKQLRFNTGGSAGDYYAHPVGVIVDGWRIAEYSQNSRFSASSISGIGG